MHAGKGPAIKALPRPAEGGLVVVFGGLWCFRARCVREAGPLPGEEQVRSFVWRRQPVPAPELRACRRGGGKAASLGSVGVGGAIVLPDTALQKASAVRERQPPSNWHSVQIVFPFGCLSHMRGKAKCNLHNKLTSFCWHVLPRGFLSVVRSLS